MSVKPMKLLAMSLMITVFLISLVSCGQSGQTSNSNSNFNFIFKYGVNAQNELDTFDGTYTRDMISDPSVTVRLILSQDEFDQILKKMEDINFFNYPDVFRIDISSGDQYKIVTPYNTYYFKVEYGSTVKELRWEDRVLNENKEADRLRELIVLIRNIIESREEYKNLPEPKGGYM
jgi:hypothetical protein